MSRYLIVCFLVVATFTSSTAQQKQPDPAAWLRSGPMLGYSEMTEVVVWLQTRRPLRAQVRFWKQGQPASSRLSDVVETSQAGDLIARFRLSGLEFGTRYDYEIYLDGLRVERPYPTTFQTQPMWRWRTDPPAFRVAVGSCAYINDPPYDRPGTPYGSDEQIFELIAKEKPDLMVWLGDDIYYREADWLTESGMRYRWAQNRELPQLQALLASTHHYAIWDDHDFGPNDSNRTYRHKETALRIFKDYWANPTYGIEGLPGVFGRFEWGDVEFFLTDGRYYRAPEDLPPGFDRGMLGEPQLRWLVESLKDSQAPFKIVAFGSQVLNPLSPYEAYNKYPEEKARLLALIREAKIPGVLFLSGDRHYTELIRIVQPGMYPLYDLTASSMTAGTSKTEIEKNNPDRVPGTWVTDVHNFSTIDVSGPSKDRRLTIRTIDVTGKERWKHEIKQAELTFPAVQ